MCNGDCSLKMIALSCLAVILIDVYVLVETISREHKIQETVSEETFEKCFKAQISHIIVFTIYATISVTSTLILITSAMVCDESSDAFEKVITALSHYMYLLFGPALFTLCCFGFTNIHNLSNQCTANSSNRMNTFDVYVLFLGATLSVAVTFCYGLRITN